MSAEYDWMCIEAGQEAVDSALESQTPMQSAAKLAHSLYTTKMKRERFYAAFRIVWRFRQVGKLSPGQAKLLALLCQGHSLKSASNVLNISYSTVQTVRNHIITKAGASTIIEAVAKLAGYQPEVKP